MTRRGLKGASDPPAVLKVGELNWLSRAIAGCGRRHWRVFGAVGWALGDADPHGDISEAVEMGEVADERREVHKGCSIRAMEDSNRQKLIKSQRSRRVRWIMSALPYGLAGSGGND